MAKDTPNTPTKEKGDNSHSKKEPSEPTPFEKFDRLAKKIVRVPKREADQRERKGRKA